MKEILGLMARYNQISNRQLFDVLESSETDVIIRDEGSYFGNILGLLNHILVTDLGWLSAYRDSNLDLPVLDSPALIFEHPGWNKNLYEHLSDLREHREKTDSLFVDFILKTSEELFEGYIEMTRSNGEQHRFPFGKVLMHLFNHQTHHRGAVSQILDKDGVENDYSNILPLLI